MDRSAEPSIREFYPDDESYVAKFSHMKFWFGSAILLIGVCLCVPLNVGSLVWLIPSAKVMRTRNSSLAIRTFHEKKDSGITGFRCHSGMSICQFPSRRRSPMFRPGKNFLDRRQHTEHLKDTNISFNPTLVDSFILLNHQSLQIP